MAGKTKRLGRGLDALIKDGVSKETTPAKKAARTEEGGVRRVAISKIKPSPLQPRRHFDAAALQELIDSIAAHGVLQPLLVRESGNRFELIAGERRFRAARAALLKKVPVLVVEADDEKVLEIALIENLQREDLNPIEEAEGYAQLTTRFKLTQEAVAKRVGKSRAAVANALRLLGLSDRIRQAVGSGALSVGHAKVLLSLESETERELLAKRVIKEGLSVRALERLVKGLSRPSRKHRPAKSDLPAEYLHTLTDELQQYFGTAVRIVPSKTLANGRRIKGSMEIDFHDNDELDRLLSAIGYSAEL